MLKRKLPYLLLLFVMPVLGWIYELLNNHSINSRNVMLPLDNQIPFLSVFIIPYVIWYLYILGYLIYFCFKDTKVYIQALTTIVLGEIICFIVYYCFQTTVPRPAVTGEGILVSLVQFIYANDQPYNCFPSIHVLTTFIIMVCSSKIKDKHVLNTLFIQAMGVLIIASTLFVKQHAILDVIGSIVLVSFVYSLVTNKSVVSVKELMFESPPEKTRVLVNNQHK
ncbi:phosphatase PAP2 family protein [Bacillus sp. 31A1R]|uniref:Phosphatase PAP2 family protein n=1 Tax=Robertmurraya mangrovi TaxID=3098077 RepID=A0ABU5J0D8_9BACI|nr:phosphatase PAP2 family protein [Bacillus sp. 31A1R]MDZ5472880.1 phosphatase PAP2 family protein [Bacillus sp. 31A1R]